MQDVKILSTIAQLEEFKQSFVWQDFLNELDRLNFELSNEQELVGEPRLEQDPNTGAKVKIQPTTAETLIHLGDLKGRKKALQYFRSIPEILCQIIENKDESDES